MYFGKSYVDRSSVLMKAQEVCLGFPIVTNMREVSAYEARHHQCGNLLRDIYARLKGTDADRVIVVRKMQQLGFRSPEILSMFFLQTFGRCVEECFLLPGKVRSKSCGDGLQPSAVAFVVLDAPLPRKVLQTLDVPTELDIGHIPVLLQRYIPRAETPAVVNPTEEAGWDVSGSPSRPSTGSDLTFDDYEALDEVLLSLVGPSLGFLRSRQY